MRDLRFRLWNPRDKVMIAGCSLNLILATTDNDFVNEFDRKKMIWLQYTGLKDKNGKEIYEGDILSYGISKVGINKGKHYTQVIEHKLGTVNGGGHGYSQENSTSGFEIGCYFGDIESCEVIGNIHQQPELLK